MGYCNGRGAHPTESFISKVEAASFSPRTGTVQKVRCGPMTGTRPNSCELIIEMANLAGCDKRLERKDPPWGRNLHVIEAS
jgi:hypothetical protein